MNSSLAPVLLFRGRLKSVADVLKEIRNNVFTQSRWEALLSYWDAVCRHGPCDPICSLHPWDEWDLLTCMALKSGVFDSLDIRNELIRQVVVGRREAGVRKWTNWLREDSGSRPNAWLRPDFVPPSPFLVVKDPLTEASRILVEPHLVDAEFCEAWMTFFCGSRHPVVTIDQWFGFRGSSFASRASV